MNNIAAIKTDVTELKSTVGEIEKSLSICMNESRSRCNNVRILGIHEDAGYSTMAAVATLLKEAFQLETEPRPDRARRTLQP